MKTLSVLSATTAMALASTSAQAAPVSLDIEMKTYGGDGAYLAVYVKDSAGQYVGTLWMSGGKSKYYKHLKGWYRATGGNTAEIQGITGASVGSGRSLSVTMDIKDALLDAGYTIHVDSSVEDRRDVVDDVVIPLSSSQSGTPVGGKGYVSSATVRF